MPEDRTILNINIDPDLHLKLKSQEIKNGKMLTGYITEKPRQKSSQRRITWEKALKNRESLT